MPEPYPAKMSNEKLIFQNRFGDLLKIRLSGVAEQIMYGYMGNPSLEYLL